MLNTKLILVDGISGSGKSTTAHYIARQLEKNGIKVKWLHEGGIDNPIILNDQDIEDAGIDDSDDSFNLWLVEFYLNQWHELSNEIAKQDSVYVMESYLFQNILRPILSADMDDVKAKELMHTLFSSIKHLNPVIIHLYQTDPISAIKKICIQRGNDWEKDIMSGTETSNFALNRNLKGMDAALAYWHKISDLALDLLNEFDCRKLLIENSAQNWNQYRKQIIDFLDIKFVAELSNSKDYDHFCGNFYGKGEYLKFHTNNENLLLDTFWKNMKMLRNSEYEFEIEGFPTCYEFLTDNNGEINRLRIVKAGHECDHELTGTILNKLNILNDLELMQFCGTYRCESEKLDRKIYLKNNDLYYWRSEDSETLLIPINSNELAMYVSGSVLSFDFKNNLKQFKLIAQDQEESIFLQTNS